MCHCVSTASSWRVYGACTAFALSVIVSIALSQRPQGGATATIVLPRRSHYVHRRLPLRCEQTQQNGIKAASSLPPPLCVQALSTSSWLLNASKPGYSLPICMSSRSRMMQTLCTSFRDEGVGGPQRRRRVWVRQWLDVDRMLQYGHYHRLMYELRYEDPVSYFNFLTARCFKEKIMGRRQRGVDAVRAPCAHRARAVTALNTRCARRGHAVSAQSIAN